MARVIQKKTASKSGEVGLYRVPRAKRTKPEAAKDQSRSAEINFEPISEAELEAAYTAERVRELDQIGRHFTP